MTFKNFELKTEAEPGTREHDAAMVEAAQELLAHPVMQARFDEIYLNVEIAFQGYCDTYYLEENPLMRIDAANFTAQIALTSGEHGALREITPKAWAKILAKLPTMRDDQDPISGTVNKELAVAISDELSPEYAQGLYRLAVLVTKLS